MPLSRKDLPPDSILQCWCEYLAMTEVPFSYQLAAGLSIIGACIRRQRWVDQVDWRVYGNQSVMFIGPSGIGKDTIINRTVRSIETIQHLTRVPVLGGVTMESLYARLLDLGSCAAAYIPAPEVTAFFGKADYQANMLTGITDLLSNGEKKDVTTKTGWSARGAGQIIYKPTLTMHAGSTVEWLHRGMPEGTLEGGFLGRFLIVVEELGSKFVPLVKAGRTREELDRLRQALAAWTEGLELLVERVVHPREVVLLDDAEDMYTNWYYNRFRQFSRAVMPYANRSRDTVLRLAMLVALSRLHDRYVDGEDMRVAIHIIADVAARIDSVVLPPSREAQVAGKVMELLPCTISALYGALGTRHSIQREIDPAVELLRKSNKIRLTREGVMEICT